MGAHDHLFKELLRTCFVPFLEEFVPELHRQLQPGAVEFLNQEQIFHREGQLASRFVDLVAQVQLRGSPGFVLIHVEHQSRRDPDIGRRLHSYTAGLMARNCQPVFPILITSYDRPATPEPDHYEIRVGGHLVLRFNYRVIQLNRLRWRDFLGKANPAVTALMAKMNVAPAERPRAKVEILRRLLRLRLDRQREQVIAGFVDHYLNLSAEEILEFERELAQVPSATERNEVMQYVTSWERKGRAAGLAEGLAEGHAEGLAEGRHSGRSGLVQRLLEHRLGPLPATLQRRIDRLSFEQLGELAVAVFDLKSTRDLRQWLAARES